MRELLLVLVLLLGGGDMTGHAQPASDASLFCKEKGRRTETLDTRGLGAVYCATNPVFTRPLAAAHASARPVFYGAVPLAWGGALVLREGDDYSDAYRLALTQGATYGLVLGLKRAVGRPRPYVYRALSARSARHSASRQDDAFTSFPSGHAALSAALVTSWGLSHPKWYVWGPGSAWAIGVSLSRLHLGVHYPSDVLVGVGIGVSVAVLVHQLRGELTPGIVNGERDVLFQAPAPVGLRIRF